MFTYFACQIQYTDGLIVIKLFLCWLVGWFPVFLTFFCSFLTCVAVLHTTSFSSTTYFVVSNFSFVYFSILFCVHVCSIYGFIYYFLRRTVVLFTNVVASGQFRNIFCINSTYLILAVNLVRNLKFM